MDYRRRVVAEVVAIRSYSDSIRCTAVRTDLSVHMHTNTRKVCQIQTDVFAIVLYSKPTKLVIVLNFA